MRSLKPRFFIPLALLLLAGAPLVAAGATVTLDPAPDLVGPMLSEGADVRYRISNTNWDQVIATSPYVGYETIVQNRNLGNHNQLNEAVWDFTFSYTAGAGYTFVLTHVSGGSPPVTASTVNWTSDFNTVSPLTSYNAIEMYAQAGSSMPSGISAAHVTVTDLAFSGTGLMTVGTLRSLYDLWDDVPPLDDGQDPDLDLQWILADTDLSVFDWALTGRVVAGFTGTAGGNIDERLKFNIKVAQLGPVVAVPADDALAFALDPVRPNPSRGGALTVRFTLPSAAPARLELLDVAGRRIASHEVGAGQHALDLGQGRRLAPGLYLVRLTQGANTRTTRVAVLQ